MAQTTSNTPKSGMVLQRIGGFFAGVVLLAGAAGPAWAGYVPSEGSPPSTNQSSLPTSSRYRPPTNPGLPSTPQSYHSSGNLSGGICPDHADGLVPPLALAPQSHVGQASSPHPTVMWYVPDTETYPLQISIYEDNQGQLGAQVYAQTLTASAGIMAFTLPADQPGLGLGDRYIWQVTARCQPNQGFTSVVAQAPIEIVELSEPVTAQLAAATNSFDRITIYAEQGLWYNALQEAGAHPNGETLSLLQDLVFVETASEPELAASMQQLIRVLQVE